MRELAEIRRKLGYFSANGAGETWIGASDVYDRMQKWEAKPDFGTGEKVDVEEKGVCCIGAVPFVVNYNVPMTCELSDESQEKLALDLGKQIAKRVSQRNEIDGCQTTRSDSIALSADVDGNRLGQEQYHCLSAADGADRSHAQGPDKKMKK